jgi:hypothetical protein
LDLVLVKVLPCRHLLDERCDVSVVEKQELPCLTLVHPSVALAKTHRLDIVHMLGEGQVLIIVAWGGFGKCIVSSICVTADLVLADLVHAELVLVLNKDL